MSVMVQEIHAVLVFDDDPVAKAIYKKTFGSSIVVATTGPQGPKGDENVLVLEHGVATPPNGTPNGTIVYRLLEEI